MSTVNKQGEKTGAPSWKMAVMTCVSGLMTVGMLVANRRLDLGMSEGEIAMAVTAITGLLGYFASPRGMM